MNKIDTRTFIREIRTERDRILESCCVAPISPKGYIAYLETGNRLTFEKEYFDRRRQLSTLGLALCIDQNHIPAVHMLEMVIWEICNEYSWALPAHLEIDNSTRYKENSPQFIDLFAAETAQSLAEILEIHQEKLSPFIQNRILEEVERRIFQPFESIKWNWETLENNWSAVIAGCIGMASLSLLEKNSNRQLAIIKRLKTSFDHYLQSFGEDGVCVEGVSYWSYGFGYYLYFAEKYYSVYKDDSFLNQPKIKEIAAFPYRVQLDQESFVPFSDAGRKERLPSGLLSFCQEQYDAVVPYYQEAPSLHVDHCYRWAPLYRNLIWTNELKNCASNKISYFPDAEWMVAKGQNGFVFAAKGGNNNESHNHNDVGHFVIGMAGDLLLTDLGAGEYTRDYFLEETRYHILNNRSLGHSVPILNDKEQMSGAGGAEGTHFFQNETGFQFEINVKEVYPKDANATDFHRKWEVDLEKGNILLHDRIHFSGSSSNLVQQNFVSTERPIVEASSVIWKGKESTLRMQTDLQCFEPIIVEEEFSNHDGSNQKAYRTVLSTRVEMDYEQKFYFSIEI